MKTPARKTRFVAWAGVVVIASLLAGPSPSGAQQATAPSKEQLIGSWKVLSYRSQYENQQDWMEPLGPHPQGYVIFTGNGRYIQMITAAGRTPPTTEAERATLLTSMIAYSGKYTVDQDRVIIIVDTSWAEAYQGERQRQVRFFKLEGNRLITRTPFQFGARSRTAGTSRGRTVTEIVMEREL